MKIKILSLFILVALSVSTFAVTISQWTFEVNTPADLNNSTTSPNAAADIGSGTASGFHTSAATDWSTPAGAGASANSISANTWASTDYWQFQVSTLGYTGISLSWDQRSSATGPRDFSLFYSTDGSAFSQFGVSYSVSSAFANFSRDLSSVVALNGDSSVFFRLVVASATAVDGNPIATTGTSSIDNFTVSGISTAVPETLPLPVATATLVGLFAAAHLLARRNEMRSTILPRERPVRISSLPK